MALLTCQIINELPFVKAWGRALNIHSVRRRKRGDEEEGAKEASCKFLIPGLSKLGVPPMVDGFQSFKTWKRSLDLREYDVF